MHQFEQFMSEKKQVKEIKSTGIFWKLSQPQREKIRKIEKMHSAGEVSKGRYSIQLSDIIQDFS